jgi:hypothetical protein
MTNLEQWQSNRLKLKGEDVERAFMHNNRRSNIATRACLDLEGWHAGEDMYGVIT